MLNRFDPSNKLHRANHEWLTKTDGFDVVTAVDALATVLCGEVLSADG